MVILENSPIGASVINVTASDPDIGPAGTVKYDIVNEFDGSGRYLRSNLYLISNFFA